MAQVPATPSHMLANFLPGRRYAPEASSTAGQNHQWQCSQGCVHWPSIPREEYAGKIVWYYGQNPHHVAQGQNTLPDHMVVILPDNFKSEEYRHDPDYFACVVLSGMPRYCYEWWRVWDAGDLSAPEDGPNLHMDAAGRGSFRFNKPTFAGIGEPVLIHQSCLHKFRTAGQDFRLRPDSLDQLCQRVGIFLGFFVGILLMRDYKDPSLYGPRNLDGGRLTAATAWGYSVEGAQSWGPYDWACDYPGPDFDGPNYWIPMIQKVRRQESYLHVDEIRPQLEVPGLCFPVDENPPQLEAHGLYFPVNESSTQLWTPGLYFPVNEIRPQLEIPTQGWYS